MLLIYWMFSVDVVVVVQDLVKIFSVVVALNIWGYVGRFDFKYDIWYEFVEIC